MCTVRNSFVAQLNQLPLINIFSSQIIRDKGTLHFEYLFTYLEIRCEIAGLSEFSLRCISQKRLKYLGSSEFLIHRTFQKFLYFRLNFPSFCLKYRGSTVFSTSLT